MRSKTKVVKSPKRAAKQLKKLGASLKGPNNVKVGLPKGSDDYPDGTSVIMVGAIHEFGSPANNIPQRSFLRATVETKRKEYKQLFKKLSKRIVDGNMTKEDALGIVGLSVQGDVQERISNGISPALKSRDGTPLIDTGHLRQSITFEVQD